MKINRQSLVAGAVFGLLTVGLGAFGAHGLKDLLLTNGKLEVWQTAVQYLSIHGLALLFLSIGSAQLSNRKHVILIISSWTIGTILFSGSLFVLALSNQPIFGAVTPIGGLLLMLGWLLLIYAALRK